MTDSNGQERLGYRIGIDVGTHSTGLVALRVGDHSWHPIEVLNAVVVIHDSGVDPSAQKQASTRLAVSGVARRMRRMIRERRKRLDRLDRWIEAQGWPLVDLEKEGSPYIPWIVRAQLATSRVEDAEDLEKRLSIALRHMSRHRGWRNPYSKVSALYVPAVSSPQLEALRERVTIETGHTPVPDATPAQVVVGLVLKGVAMRGPKGVLGGKLMQSDNANELRRIADVQGIEPALLKEMIDRVFEARSPRGSAEERVGRDALPGQENLRRASKADEEFQRFRIASTVANLRVREGDRRRLTAAEQELVIHFLMSEGSTRERTTWDDVAEALGVPRAALEGTAATGTDGERPSASPPVNITDRRIRGLRIPPVVEWWTLASPEERSAFISEMSNASGLTDENDDVLEEVSSLIGSLTDEQVERLGNLSLPAGRAAYSRESLRRLSDRMLRDGVDLTEARMREFGVPGDWQPPSDPIGAPVGNPAVDRVTKQVARWLRQVVAKWGDPLSVNIEHVRSALGSEAQARELDRENNRRFVRNQKVLAVMQEQMGITSKNRRSDLNRYLAIQRQNGQCAYCGTSINFVDAEMDHIVPRAGEGGARSTRENLVATCERCNRAKSNLPFAAWAEIADIPGVSVNDAVARVRHWIPDPGAPAKENRKLVDGVVRRLSKRSEDAAIDDRAMESVAWMANELHTRIRNHFLSRRAEVNVMVYRGAITAEARRASGLEGRINLIGGRGKTRLDRRHHAVDAAVIALIRPSVAKTLAQRSSLRVAEQMTQREETWKRFEGDSTSARVLYRRWFDDMNALSDILNSELQRGRIPVVQNLRLRLGDSRAHEDKVRRLQSVVLSGAISAAEIDRASTPALWCALTRLSDYDPKTGLKANPARKIVVNGKAYGPLDPIPVFGTGSACIAVRGGYAELGSAVHHARIFRLGGKKTTYAMLRVYQVDLARHVGEDLFSVPLGPQSISLRTAEAKLRNSLAAGDAEYIGWLVMDDEVRIQPGHSRTGQIGAFLEEFPMIANWRIDGFESPTRLRLRPTLLSSEGLNSNSSEAAKKTLDSPGWKVGVNVVFNSAGTEVIRRTALGTERRDGTSGLPVCWSPQSGG